jgi:hypothetical protein
MNLIQNPARSSRRAISRRGKRYRSNRHPVNSNSTPIRVEKQIALPLIFRSQGDEPVGEQLYLWGVRND